MTRDRQQSPDRAMRTYALHVAMCNTFESVGGKHFSSPYCKRWSSQSYAHRVHRCCCLRLRTWVTTHLRFPLPPRPPSIVGMVSHGQVHNTTRWCRHRCNWLSIVRLAIEACAMLNMHIYIVYTLKDDLYLYPSFLASLGVLRDE